MTELSNLVYRLNYFFQTGGFKFIYIRLGKFELCCECRKARTTEHL